jgi:hypothetical protein
MVLDTYDHGFGDLAAAVSSVTTQRKQRCDALLRTCDNFRYVCEYVCVRAYPIYDLPRTIIDLRAESVVIFLPGERRCDSTWLV